MTEKRGSWFAAGILLIAAGLAAGVATHVWWLPCRGQMLNGAFYWFIDPEYTFTDGCLERMDEGTAFPGPAFLAENPAGIALATAAVVVTGLAYAVPVVSQPHLGPRRLILLLPGLFAIVLGSTTLIPVTLPDGVLAAALHLLGFSLLAALAVVLSLREHLRLWRWIIAVGAVTSFSLVGVMLDYALMSSWSDANWDAPPGSGYPTAGWLVLCGLLIIGLTLLPHRRATADQTSAATPTQQVQQVGPVT